MELKNVFYKEKIHGTFETQVSGKQVAGVSAQVLGFRYQVSGSRCQVTGFRFQVPGSRYQVPGVRFQVPGARFHAPSAEGTMSLISRIWSRVKMLITFTLKMFYVLAEFTNLQTLC